MPNLRVSLLGLLQLHRDEQRLNLGTPQQQALFVALLLRDGRTADAATLIEALWGSDTPTSAIRTLRTYAWRLRKVLEDDTKFPSTLVSVGDGYQLVLDGHYVDFEEAENLARQARQARQAHDFEDAYDLLEEALSLWHGEPLTAIPGPFAARQRDRLNEVRLYLQEERMAVGLALGHGLRYISELPGLIDQYPFRERLYTLLIQAQYQSGRRADALDTFRQARRVLIDELGVEPGPELNALHRRVLAGDEELLETRPPRKSERAAPADEPAPAVGKEPAPAAQTRMSPQDRDDMPYPCPGQLPPDLTDFTGRSHLTLTISSLMNTPHRSALPVVVLVGMAGVGKSALALHVAHTIRDSYPEGQLYANLRAGDGGPVQPDDVLAEFLVSLGLRRDDVPAAVKARTALLRTMLSRRRILLVLDDAVNAEQVRPLLPGSAECGVLITTRTRLPGLPALQVDVPAFSPSEALDFMARTIGSERIEAEHAVAQEIVESCAMLPLAIRIVAARLTARPNWSLQSLSMRLADKFKRIEELRSGSMTISAIFDLTYRHLSEEQAIALRRTAIVDSPSLSLSCAAVLLDLTDGDAETLLEALVDQAMLESPSPGRYRFHSLLRDFARCKALPSEQVQAKARLLDYLLASAKNGFARVVPGDPMEGAISATLGRGAQLGDPAEARDWVAEHGECALDLVQQLARGMVVGSEPREHMPPPVVHTQLRLCVDLLIALSAFRGALSHDLFQKAVDMLERAVATSQDPFLVGRVRFLRGHLELAMNQFARAEQQASIAVRLCHSSDDLVILRQALNDLGLAKQMQQKYNEAIESYEKAVDLARRLGHTSGETATTLNMALSKVHMGEPLEAERICQQVLDEVVSPDDVEGISYAYYIFGLAGRRLGNHELAVNWFEECLTLCISNGLRAREGHARLRLAESLRVVKHLDRAKAEAQISVKLCEEMADRNNLTQALTVLGNVLRDLGQEPAAQENLARAQEVLAGLRPSSDVGQLPSRPPRVGVLTALNSPEARGAAEGSPLSGCQVLPGRPRQTD